MATLIYGKNPVREALKASRNFLEAYVLEGQNNDVIDMLKERQVKVKYLTKQKMQTMFPSSHQGVGALVDDYDTISLKEALAKPGRKLFVMLDSLEDPHNLGAILRTAEAFNISGVIIPKNRSVQITPTVVKVSAGAIEYVDIISVTNLNQTIQTLKSHNIWVVGTDLDAKQNVSEIHPDTDICVVFGSEGKGLGRLIKESCDYLVKIPMQGKINSLNVSVSCGIILHDIIQRRG